MIASRLARSSVRTARIPLAAASRSTAVTTSLAGTATTRLTANQAAPLSLSRWLHSHGPRSAAAHSAPLPLEAEQVSVSLVPSETDPKIVVDWGNGQKSTFDNEFLFDHCRCEACFHAGTKQRLKTLNRVPSNIPAAEVSVKDGAVHVVWKTETPHESTFPLSFLQQASYDPPLLPRAPLLDQTPLTRWGSDIAKNPPSVSYASVMPEKAGNEAAEQGVLDWLNKVHEYGFCFVTNVPATAEATEELIRRMSFIRETHYGGFWDFTADMSKGDLAYSNVFLPAHHDTTYFTDSAGLQIFHCLSHPSPPGTGGETLLVDAFAAAAELAKRDPAAYKTLSTLALSGHASGNDGTILRPNDWTVLRHDHHGRLTDVRWNNEDRCVLGDGWTPEEIREWYRAARVFEGIITSPESEYWVKLTPGNMVVIDNWRVMHGRAGFTGKRRMCGAYVGADDWKSRRRALLKEFGGSGVKQNMWSYGW